MSSKYYADLWLATARDLGELLDLDRNLQEDLSIGTNREALARSLPLYLKYRNIVGRLIVCHNQTLQSQKRDLIKQTLDCAIGRMLEYKREIVDLDCADYQWPDNLMIEMKFTPDDVLLEPPANYYKGERGDFLEKRRRYIDELIIEDQTKQAEDSMGKTMDETTTSSSKFSSNEDRSYKTKSSRFQVFQESPEKRKTREENERKARELKDAIVLIQAHERARVGRLAADHEHRARIFYKRLMDQEETERKVDKDLEMQAAVVIQRAWRSYSGRKELKKRIDSLENLLGMTVPSWRSKRILETDEENFERRLNLQPLYSRQTEKVVGEEKNRILRERGPGLMEDITDELREWFILWYNQLGFFDAFPTKETGGSVLVVTGQTLTPEEYRLEQKKTKGGEGKAKNTEDRESNRKGKRKEKKSKKEGGKDKGWRMPESRNFEELVIRHREFIHNRNSKGVQDHDDKKVDEVDVELITEELCYKLQLEMREIVDEIMRLELENLNAALMKDHAADKKAFAKSIPKQKKQKKKGKGEKKKKKNKKRKGTDKDESEESSMEDLFHELVKAQIIRNYPKACLRDWVGDLSYQNYEAQLESRDYQHRLGEILQNVMEYCVLPLGSKEVHRIVPLTRSVSICGLPEYGQEILANAISTQTGALVVDLTPSIPLAEYLAKTKGKKLVDGITKVSKFYAPTVILLDGAEKVWAKKVPPEDRVLQPKRVAPLVPKLIKTIKPGDQVLFISLCSAPHKTTQGFLKAHDKFIIMPLTDYNTLYMFYKNQLMKYHGIDRNFDVSCLARMSIGLPIEFLRKVIDRVLTAERIITLYSKPLRPTEIMEEVLKYDAMKPKEMQQYRNFEQKTPLAKKRRKMLEREKMSKEKGSKKKT